MDVIASHGRPIRISTSLVSIQQGHATAAHTPSLKKIPVEQLHPKFCHTTVRPCPCPTHSVLSAAATLAQPGAVAAACTGDEALRVEVTRAPSTGSGTSQSSAIVAQSTGAWDDAGGSVGTDYLNPLPASSTQPCHHCWVWVLRTLLQNDFTPARSNVNPKCH